MELYEQSKKVFQNEFDWLCMWNIKRMSYTVHVLHIFFMLYWIMGFNDITAPCDLINYDINKISWAQKVIVLFEITKIKITQYTFTITPDKRGHPCIFLIPAWIIRIAWVRCFWWLPHSMYLWRNNENISSFHLKKKCLMRSYSYSP